MRLYFRSKQSLCSCCKK